MHVASSIEIDRPAEDVFAFVAEVANNPRWQRGQRSCRWTTGPPLRVGSSYDQRARFLGRDLVNSFQVDDLDPGRRIRFTSTGGTFPLTITRSVEPIHAERARFTEHVDGGPRGAFRVAEPLLRRMVERAIRRDLPRLKRLLEGHGAASGEPS